MAWTYSFNPEASFKDAVRFEIQDTNEAAPLLQDEEIMAAIVKEAGGSVEVSEHGILASSARCCEVLARRFAKKADVVVGSLQSTYSKQAAGYRKQAVELRNRAAGYGEPVAGGQSRSRKRALRQDNDRVQPIFRRGQNQMRRVRTFDDVPPPVASGGLVEEEDVA